MGPGKMQKLPDRVPFYTHFYPISPHFSPFFFLVGTSSYIFHDVFVTISHFPPCFPISPYFPHFPHFSVACWIFGYSEYGYFLGLILAQ